MGNTQPGEINKKLGVAIIGKIDSTLSRTPSDRGIVQGCYILYPDNTLPYPLARLFNVLLVTPRGIEMFCLLTGETRHPKYFPIGNTTIVSSVFSTNYISCPHIIVAESNASFAVVNAYTLTTDKRVGITNNLPSLNATKNIIFTMISIAPEIIYVGYLSGIVKVWHTEVANPQFIFGKEYEEPAVRSLAYSPKHRKIIIGFEGSYENQHGRFVKLDKNVLKAYVPNASEAENEAFLLESFAGTCFAIGIIDRLDLVLAISSENSGLYAWSLVSHELLMRITIPKLGEHSQVMTQLLVIERPDSNYLILGSSDGTILISEIVIEEKDIVWKPIKRIVMKLEGNYAIEYMKYEEKIDTLIIGNTFATATFISNFFATGLNQELSVQHELKIDD